MNKIQITILLTIFSIINLYSQDQLNSFSPGAKSIAMGRTGVVQIKDPTALYWNPALLGDVKRQSAIVAVNEPHHLTYTGYSMFFPMTGTFAASVSHTQQGANGIELYSVGWGKQISRYVFAGAAVNNIISQDENWVTTGIGLYINSYAASYSTYKTFSPLAFLNGPLFRNRFAMGLSMQNVPLTETKHDHQTRVGASYKLTEDGFTIMFAYQMQSVANTSHLSLILPIQKNIKFIAGTKDYQFNKTAIGTELILGGLDLQLVYDYDVERILFSTSIHIGQSPTDLSQAEHLRAKEAVENQMPDIALDHTRRALEYDVHNSEAQKFYSILDPLIKQNRIKAAKTLQTAQQLEQSNWYISAAMHYMQALKLDPENKSALQALERIRPRVNVQTENRFELGKTTYENGEYVKAKEIFETILQVRPGHEQSKYYLQRTNTQLENLAENHFYTGLGYFSQKQYANAEKEFKTALALYSDYTEASEYIERIERINKNNQQQVTKLIKEAQALENRNAWLQARSRYQEILALAPGHNLASERLQQVNKKLDAIVNQYINQGIKQYNQGDQKAADNTFRQILKLSPNNATARQYIQRINANTTSLTQSSIDRANAQIQAQNWLAAQAIVDSILTKYPNHSQAKELASKIATHQDVSILLTKARLEYNNSNYIQALQLCEQVLDKDAENSQAIRLIQQSQTRLDEMVDNYFNKGLEMYTKENYRTAILMWEKALEIDPDHSGSLEYLKRARERLSAIEQLQNQ